MRGEYARCVPTYRLHDTTPDDLGFLEHPAPNIEPGTWSSFRTGERRSLRLASGLEPGPLAALLEVVIAPSRLEADDALP